MKKACIAIILPLLVLGSGLISWAQGNEVPDAFSGYLLEVSRESGAVPTFQTLEQNSLYGAWQPLPDWKPTSGEAQVSGISLHPHIENGSVMIKVVVVRGDYLDTQESIADYKIGAAATVLEAMKKVGIVPFIVRLVRAAPTIAALPVVENKTRSLTVTVEPVSATLPSFKARVTNNSAKAVTAIAYQSSIDGRISNTGTPWNTNGGDLIAPGAAYEMTLRDPSPPETGAGTDVPKKRSALKLEIVSVVFADGSYEGDAVPAARFRGRKFGEKLQLTRIVTLLRSPAAESAETLGRAVDQLSFEVTLENIKPLMAEFPDVPTQAWESVRGTAELSAHNFEKEFRSTFGSTSKIPPAVFADAVRSVLTRCENRINSLP